MLQCFRSTQGIWEGGAENELKSKVPNARRINKNNNRKEIVNEYLGQKNWVKQRNQTEET